MVRLSPQLLIATTRALAGMGVTGEMDFVDAQDRPPSWDTRFVLQCGYWSHYEHRTRTSTWPIPAGLTTDELALFGMAHHILHGAPEPGDIFLQYAEQRKTFVHTGVVLDVLASHGVDTRKPYFDVYTIEGDTDKVGRLQRGKTMRVRRRLSPVLGDRFLRWVDLGDHDPRRVRRITEAVANARPSAP